MVLAAVLLTAIGILGIAGLGDRTPGGVPTVAPAPAAARTSRASPTRSPGIPSARTSSSRAPRRAPATCSTRSRPAGSPRARARVAPLAPEIEAAADEAGRRPRHARGPRVPRERRPRRRGHAERRRGRGRADADPRRHGHRPARHAGRHGRSAQLGRRIDREQSRGRRGPGPRLRRERARGRRALRRRQGARRDRALPEARPRDARPRGLRVRLLPHGDRQPAGRAARVRRGPRAGPRSTSTPASPATREAYGRLLKLGDDSSNYYWKVLAGAGDHAAVPRRPHGARAAGRAARRQGLRRGGPAPARLRPAVRRPGPAARRVGRRADRRLPRHARRHRASSATRRWASWRGASASRPALYRGLRPEALAMALYIGAQVRALSGDAPLRRDLDGARRGLPARARQAATARRPATSRCTPRAGRSTSTAATSRARQALAFQNVLDRLSVLGGITWVREPDAIHVTVSSRGQGPAAPARPDRTQP